MGVLLVWGLAACWTSTVRHTAGFRCWATGAANGGSPTRVEVLHCALVPEAERVDWTRRVLEVG
jgi:hypothetical protein